MTPAAGSSADEPFDRRYTGCTALINGVRFDIDAWLTEHAADDETRSRAALIVSELVSNAVQASPGRPFFLSARRTGPTSVCLVVTNREADAQIPLRRDWGPDDLLAPGGRGLAIVDALCDSVDISTSTEGDVTVEATFTAAFTAS